ncbi:MAG: 4'-phosphopantetheinyl transferase superfamily protein [Saprospiraceae bacterium]|nr:4'-phosphopantetheinyl transferase superfamily protein [Saprospiraceae bacterium]
MPLLLATHPFPETSFGLWQIAEEESFFRKELPLSVEEEAELANLKNIRRLEWLASRWLLHKLTGAPQRLPLVKNTFAKPFFLDNPDLFCSLSHSHGIVGALLARQNVGCDIQVLVEKMPRLAPKFLNEAEMTFINRHTASVQFDLMHVFWTAKESLYKAYGLKELDFRGHMHLDPFEWQGTGGTSTGWVNKAEVRQAYRLRFEKIDLPEAGALMWTVCLPESQDV